MNCEFTINGYTKDDIKERGPASRESMIWLWNFATNHIFSVAEETGLSAGKRLAQSYLLQMRRDFISHEREIADEWSVTITVLFQGISTDRRPDPELVARLAQGYAANPAYAYIDNGDLIDSILTVAKGVTDGLHDSD
jgi:hypothetical protein